MVRKKNIHGGGAQTNLNGLAFEQSTDLINWITKIHFLRIANKNQIYFGTKKIASVFQQRKFYKEFLFKDFAIDYKNYLSKQLLPDCALIHHKKKIIFIIEKKFQSSAGSVDEKLQTCDFKKKMYTKLTRDTGHKLEFIYLLSDWFEKKEYGDVKKYIKSVGCSFYFNQLPLETISLDEDFLKSIK